MSESAFTVAVDRRDNSIRVSLTGELDLTTVPQFDAAVTPPHEGDTLVIDLDRLQFIDSTGVRALMQLDLAARAEGWSLVLACPRGHVKRVLETCHVHHRITIVDDTVTAALTPSGYGPS